LHSRIAEVKNQYEAAGLDAIPDEHAHPNIDFKSRIALFHNGRIANSEDLLKKL
jgi:glucosamine 6-phosphate synthetase-like amidotransferase/phosphosugar isomerase protein